MRPTLWMLGAALGVMMIASAWFAAQLRAQSSGAASQDDSWKEAPPTSTGVPVGQKIPVFSLPDQEGKLQDFNSIKGPNGAAIYFMRSADW
jgi:hypothetical protein